MEVQRIICGRGPVGSRTPVLNTSVLEIYTAFFTNVSFNSALAMQEIGSTVKLTSTTIVFYPKLWKKGVLILLNLWLKLPQPLLLQKK